MSEPVVIEYRNTRSLFDGTISYEGIVITATAQMNAAYRKMAGSVHSFSIREILEKMLDDWYSSKSELRRMIALDDIIDSIGINDPEFIQSALKSKKELLEAVRLLVDIGVRPSSLPKNTEEQRFFAEIYTRLIDDQRSAISEVWHELDDWMTPGHFARKLFDNLESIKDLHAVYFQGFYYVTPIQVRLMKAFYTLDIPVYFLNNYDSRQPDDYAIWRLNPLFWHKEHQCLFDEDDVPEPDDTSITKFKDTFSMVHYYHEIDENAEIFVPMTSELRKMMLTFFPDRENKSHMLAYPAGRYLFNLYDMWNPFANRPRILPESIRSCLATGWAGGTAEERERMLQIYDRVQTFFMDCSTIEEWEKRTDFLLDIQQELMPLFHRDYGNQVPGRWQPVLSNPLAMLGPLSCRREDIIMLATAIQRIADDCKAMYADGQRTNLKVHFATLKNLLEKRISIVDVHDEEKAIVKEFVRRLSAQDFETDAFCSTRGLSEAMAFFLGGESEPDDDGSKAGQTYPLESVEAARFLCNGKHIIIACCDTKNLPGEEKDYPWPLNSQMMYDLPMDTEQRERYECENARLENVRLANRYLFHLAANTENVEFSWISEMKGKELSPSVFLLQMINKRDMQITEKSGFILDNNSIEKKACKAFESAPIEMFAQDTSNLPEVKMDMMACKKKYWRVLYDYLLQDRPVYTSEYIIPFYLTTLIVDMSEMTGTPIRQAARYLFAIFPSFKESQQEQIISFAKRKQDNQNLRTESSGYLGKRYSNRRFYQEFLRNQFVDNVLRGDSNENLGCQWCSHSDVCFARTMSRGEYDDDK